MDQDNKDNDNTSRKRARDDSDDSGCDSPEFKLSRVGSVNSGLNSTELYQNLSGSDNSGFNSVELGDNRFDTDDSGVNSPEVKRIQDDLLDILDDSDEPAIQGLDSVIKSFEEEILVADPALGPAVVEVTSHCGGSQPDLGYLLEASDDELGLPPTFSSGDEEKIGAVDFEVVSGSGAVGFGEMLGFEHEIASYDSFEFGLGCNPDGNSYASNYNDGGDFVALGGLFDYSDENFVPPDVSGLQRQPESMSAS